LEVEEVYECVYLGLPLFHFCRYASTFQFYTWNCFSSVTCYTQILFFFYNFDNSFTRPWKKGM